MRKSEQDLIKNTYI